MTSLNPYSVTCTEPIDFNLYYFYPNIVSIDTRRSYCYHVTHIINIFFVVIDTSIDLKVK